MSDHHRARARRLPGTRRGELGGQGCGVAVHRVVAAGMAHLRGLGIRQRMDRDRSMLVAQHQRPGIRLHRPADGQPGALQQAGAEGDAVGAVVVAGDHHHRDPELQHELLEHQVEQAHRLGRRHRAVIDVAGEQDRVGSAVGGDANELGQHVGLVLEQGDAVMDTAEMPVGGMEETHREATVPKNAGPAVCRQTRPTQPARRLATGDEGCDAADGPEPARTARGASSLHRAH